MDLSTVYNNPNYSDLTIILKDGREVKVHKNILCTSNLWFKKACGVDSQFAEATQPVLELKHDDPDALEHVLHHIYKIHPWRLDIMSWHHWLNVHQTADKYLEFTLSALARNEFSRIAYSQQDSNEIFDIIETINGGEVKDDDGFIQLARSLRENNVEALLQNDRVCKKVDEDRSWRWDMINTLVGQRKRSVEHSVFVCPEHLKQVFVPGRKEKIENCSLCRENGIKAMVKPCIVHFGK